MKNKCENEIRKNDDLNTILICRDSQMKEKSGHLLPLILRYNFCDRI